MALEDAGTVASVFDLGGVVSLLIHLLGRRSFFPDSHRFWFKEPPLTMITRRRVLHLALAVACTCRKTPVG